MWKVLDLNTNVINFENGREVRPLFGGRYSLVFRRFLSNCLLATFRSEGKNRRYLVFFKYKSTRLKRVSQQTTSRKNLFEAVFGKVFCTNAPMLRKACSFLFYKLFSFKFWVLGSLKVLNLDFVRFIATQDTMGSL